MSSIAEEIELQRGLSEAARNQPSLGPPDFEDDPNYGIRVHAHQNPDRTLVPKHMFKKIDSFHLNLLHIPLTGIRKYDKRNKCCNDSQNSLKGDKTGLSAVLLSNVAEAPRYLRRPTAGTSGRLRIK
jgi:hypothetical protein